MATDSDRERHAPEDELMERVWEPLSKWLQENWAYVVLGIAVVAAAAMGWRAWRLHERSRRMTAWNRLAAVPTAQLRQMPAMPQAAEPREQALAELRSIAEDYAGEPAAAWALLQMAALQASGGSWDDALATYELLARRYPESMAVRAAAPARAAALEAVGRYADSADAYAALAREQNPLYYFAEGRTRELADQQEQALQAYRAFLDSEAADELARRIARDRLADVQRGRLLSEPPDMATPQPALPDGPDAPGMPDGPDGTGATDGADPLPELSVPADEAPPGAQEPALPPTDRTQPQ